MNDLREIAKSVNRQERLLDYRPEAYDVICAHTSAFSISRSQSHCFTHPALSPEVIQLHSFNACSLTLSATRSTT